MEHERPGGHNPSEAEHRTKGLLLIQAAKKFGYDGEVGSLAELTHRRWPDDEFSHEAEVVAAAHYELDYVLTCKYY
jgi:hypothetical protein